MKIAHGRNAVMGGDRQIGANGKRQEQGLLLAVFRHEANALCDGISGVRRFGLAADHNDLAGVDTSAPKMARAVSVRPAPTRPAMPRISPLLTAKDTSCSSMALASVFLRRRERPLTARAATSPWRRALARRQQAEFAAHHQADDAVDAWCRRPCPRPTWRPSRSTV